MHKMSSNNQRETTHGTGNIQLSQERISDEACSGPTTNPLRRRTGALSHVRHLNSRPFSASHPAKCKDLNSLN